jgi:uncharacterized protein YegL
MLQDAQFAENPEPRCPVLLLLDISGSMSGNPITELNAGITTFKQEVAHDDMAALRVEVAIITFDATVKLLQDFIIIDEFEPPNLAINVSTSGGTVMGSAIEMALEQVENRKALYRNNGIKYYQPWVFLITDGAPTDSWEIAARKVRQTDADQKISFYAVGVQGANMEILTQIAPPNTPPMQLDGLGFKSLFRWLSQSMTKVSGGKIVPYDSNVELVRQDNNWITNSQTQTALPPVNWIAKRI